MKRVLAALAVFSALLMTGCGTSAADKQKIADQEKRINILESQVSELKKTVYTPQTPPTPTPAPTPAPAPGGKTKNPGKTK